MKAQGFTLEVQKFKDPVSKIKAEGSRFKSSKAQGSRFKSSKVQGSRLKGPKVKGSRIKDQSSGIQVQNKN